MHILTVEKDVELHYLYKYALREINCQLVLTDNGQEALQHLQQHTPQLIYMNMMLPIVSGKELLDYIEITPRLRSTHIAIICTIPNVQRYIAHLPSAEFQLKPILPTDIRRIALKAMANLG